MKKEHREKINIKLENGKLHTYKQRPGARIHYLYLKFKNKSILKNFNQEKIKKSDDKKVQKRYIIHRLHL